MTVYLSIIRKFACNYSRQKYIEPSNNDFIISRVSGLGGRPGPLE